MAKPAMNRRFCVAPMLDWTDRHERFLLRLISKQAVLYTEMVTTGAILFGDQQRHLDFDQQEQPLALQLGGSEPDDMARCAEIAQEWGYDEVNINVGCPSDRVQSGQFGACLMLQPDLVAENVKAMQAVTDLPVTVKCRIGVDEQEPREALWQLVEACANVGTQTFIVHARKAWLKGLSPKQNRDVPPLNYELVYELKRSFPELEIVLNGGITTLDQSHAHLEHVDGVMMGREAYSNPYVLAEVDRQFYGECQAPKTRDQIMRDFVSYIDAQLLEKHETGIRLNNMAKHLLGLYHGEPRSRLWRRHISENAHKPDADSSVIQKAWEVMVAG